MVADPAATDPLTPHQAALRYAQCGLRVVPIAPGHKHPKLDAWQTAATSDPALIDAWWTGLYRGHGVGLLMGHNQIFALDIDVSDGKHGDETLRDLEDTYHELPETVEQITGSGGRHLLYRAPPGTEIRNDAGRKLGPGLDIRGVGGQIVAAPSIHPNGAPYVWVWDSAPWEREVADAPDWLIALLTREDAPWDTASSSTKTTQMSSGPNAAAGPGPTGPATTQPTSSILGSSTARPGDRFNQQTTWPELLEADGWTRNRDGHEGEQRWTRPGKSAREGISATVGYKGSDVLKVFTSSVPTLEIDRTYDRFGYWAATRFSGSISDAARALGAAQRDEDVRAIVGTWDGTRSGPPLAAGGPSDASEADVVEAHDQTTGPGLARWQIDWPTFWTQDHGDTEWLLEPLLARGRGHALYATAKSGKSLLLLEAAAALATGRPFLNQPPAPPQTVLYLDYEMSEADLVERLDTMGYGPEDDLSHLHYILLPSIPGLDTHEGARYVIEAATAWQAVLVIIDTTARAVEGEENSADTFRAFYRHLGLALKSHGVTYVRADHAGKDAEKGQRGSSAKNDDVDVVWWYLRKEGGAELTTKYRRMAWVPEKVDLRIIEDPILAHKVADVPAYPAGTRACIDDLKRLDVPTHTSFRKAAKALRDAGLGVRNDVVAAAVKARKMAGNTSGNTLATDLLGTTVGTAGNISKPAGQTVGNTPGNTGEHSVEPTWGTFPLSRGGTVPQAAPETPPPWDPFDSPDQGATP